MNIAWQKASLAAASLAMAGLGFAALLFAVGPTNAGGEFVIEVNEDGFNPPLCIVNNVNAGTTIYWQNVGEKVHRVVVPQAGVNSPPKYDTGDMKPGEMSDHGYELTDNNVNLNYKDEYNPDLTGIIRAVVNGAPSCDKQAPTPTPTATPTVTPTPDGRKVYVPQIVKGDDETPTPTATLPPATQTPEPTPTATTQPSGPIEYTVMPGDVLLDIAAAHNTTVDAILALNPNLDPDFIVPGQVILIPAP